LDPAITSPTNAKAVFVADRLNGSGIVDLTLTAGSSQGDDPTAASFAPGTIQFAESVDLRVANSIALDAARISLAPGVAVTLEGVATDRSLAASRTNYIALRGAGSADPSLLPAGTGTLNVRAKMIDIAAGGSGTSVGTYAITLAGVASANFDSSGE